MGLRTPTTPAQTGLTFPSRQQRREQTATGAVQMTAPLAAGAQPGGLAALDARSLAQAGAQAGVQQQQAVTQAVQQGAQEQTAAAEEQLAEAKAKKESDLRQLRVLVSRQGRELSELLYKEDASAQGELFDANMRFEQDELGRTKLNDRQLADYAVTAAKDQEQLADYEQEVAQALERKEYVLRRSYEVLEQSERQLFEREDNEANQELKRRIAEAKAKLEADMARLANKAANNAALWGGVTAAGMAIAPIFPPAGLAIAAVGVAGGLASQQQTKSEAQRRQNQGANV